MTKYYNRGKMIIEVKDTTHYQLKKYVYCFGLMVLIFLIVFLSHTQNLYVNNSMVNNTVKIFNITKAAEKTKFYVSTKQRYIGHGMKYILLWTTHTATPFVYFGEGQTIFIRRNCYWTNCYVTSDRNYLGFYTEFDVIAFNGPQLSNIARFQDIPSKRSVHQKYVYANIEAAVNYPINTNMWNGFFNWTWTYKLNSDAIWGYIAVRNNNNEVIGPKVNMHWINIDDMDEIDSVLKANLKSKSKAAAWFSSNCHTMSRREIYVKKLQHELLKYNLKVDIYGTCGNFQCPREIMDRCLKHLRKHYYFYFAFENALSEDYVTEKIVYALNHDTVPVVFGGANYSRFMPDGIYLNALQLGPQALANKMNEAIQTPRIYHNFFKWRKYYSYSFRNERPDADDYCRFCALLNDEILMKSTKIYESFNWWWKTNNNSLQNVLMNDDVSVY